MHAPNHVLTVGSIHLHLTSSCCDLLWPIPIFHCPHIAQTRSSTRLQPYPKPSTYPLQPCLNPSTSRLQPYLNPSTSPLQPYPLPTPSHQEMDRLVSELESIWKCFAFDGDGEPTGVEWLPVDHVGQALCTDLGYEDMPEFEDALKGEAVIEGSIAVA